LRQCPPILEWIAAQCLLTADQQGNIVILPNYELNHEYQDLWQVLEPIAEDVAALLTEEKSKSLYERMEAAGSRPGALARALIGPPPQRLLAAFSLGSLDRQTPLFYPMLGHEVGHLIELETRHSAGHDQELFVPGLHELTDEFPVQRGAVSDPGCSHKRSFAHGWLRELAADLIGLRLFGPSYLFALSCFLMPFGEESSCVHSNREGSSYPSTRFRLRVLLDHLQKQEGSLPGAVSRCLDLLAPDLAPREAFFEQTSREPHEQHALSPDDKESLGRLLDQCEAKIRDRILWSPLPSEEDLTKMVEAIELGVPPLPAGIEAGVGRHKLNSAAQVLLAGWVYYLKPHLGEQVAPPEGRGPTSADLEAISVLLEKSLELIGDFTEEESAKLSSTHEKLKPVTPPATGALSGGALKHYVSLSAADRLHIVPLNRSSFEAVSYDLHLGRWFKLARKTQMPQLHIQKKEDRQRILRDAYELFHVHGEGDHGSFVLHPQDFALAVTKEYLSLPRDLMAFIDGKSGIGRTGLSIATAAQIAPGFRGCIVLELFNVGTVPLTLTPGMDIAQLVFQRFSPALDPADVYRGDFAGKIRP
jgi:dCTP deaminase